MHKSYTSIITIFVVLATLASLSGCDRLFGASEQELVQRAKGFQEKGDVKAAVIELKNVLQKNPNNGEARLLLGQVYVLKAQGENAEKELSKALQLGIKKELVDVPMGQAWLLQQKYDRVLKEIKLDSNVSPKDAAKIQQIQADAHLALGHKEEGCALYKQAMQSDSSYIPIYWGMAQCAVADKDLNRAISQLQIALKIEPKNAASWILLGNIENLRGDAAAEESAYKTAVNSEPANIKAHLSLASYYLSQAKLDSALSEINATRKLEPNNLLARYLQAGVFAKQAKYGEARDSLQEVLRYAPDHMPSVYLAGVVALQLSNFEQAEKYANKFLEKYPGNTAALRLLALTQYKSGQISRAQETLAPLLASSTQDAEILNLAGEIALHNLDYAKASDYFSKAAAIQPQNSKYRTQLGISYMAAGDPLRAIPELTAAAKQDVAENKADTILILAYLGKYEWDKALGAISALEKKRANNPEVYYFRGASYLGKKDLPNARKNFEQAIALQPKYVSAVISLAQLDLQEKNKPAARKRFEDLLAKDNNNFQAMLALAELSDSDKEAVSWLERGVKSNPGAILPRQLLVEYYLKKHDLKQALSTAMDAQKANPENPEFGHLLGATQFGAGEKKEALATYVKLANQSPNSALAQYRVATIQMALKSTAEAKDSLNKAIALKPDYLDAQKALASLEVSLGNPSEAIKIARTVQKQLPKSPQGYVTQRDIYASQKNYPDALSAYEHAMSLAKDGVIAIKIYQAQSDAGSNKADAWLLQWLKENPNESAVRAYLASSYMKSSKNKPAIEQYQFLLKQNPNNVLALNNLAWLYHHEKDSRALPTAELAYKLKPEIAAVGDTYGLILLEQGRVSHALEVLKNALTHDPNNPEIRFHYASALAKSGDKVKAKQELQQLLGSKQQFPQLEEAKVLLKQL